MSVTHLVTSYLGSLEAKDYISVFALVVSLLSAAVSIRSWRFNAKVKSLEMRALLLSSLHSTLVKGENLKADYARCKDAALDAKEIELFKQFTKENLLEELIEELRDHIEEVEAASGHKTIAIYQRSFSRFTFLSLRIDDISNNMSTVKSQIIMLPDRTTTPTAPTE